MLIQKTPTRVYLEGLDMDQVRKHLQYQDLKVDYEIRKHKQAYWYIQKHGEEAHQQRLEELKAERIKTILFEDETGFWTYSGLKDFLATKFRDSISNTVTYPESRIIPWYKVPDKKPRPYQQQMLDKLIEAKHGAVEVATGAGKTFVEMLLAKHHGLKTVVVTPSVSICQQIYDEFLEHFGAKSVGMFGNGKKEFKKLFTIAISNSLTLLKEGSEAWEEIVKAQVLIFDESHLTPATTFARICFGVCAQAPYRYFLSGTQIRNDGLDLLLHAITGDVVFKMSVKDGVDQGWLAKPVFRMVRLESEVNYYRDDPMAMTRNHLYYSPKVNAVAANLANQLVEHTGRPVLIMIEEMEQFACLVPHLKYDFRFAHGGCTKENKDKVPAAFHKKPNTKALVEAHNNKEFPILIGTSCIGTGTDFKSVGAIIYLQGGTSEIQIRQAVGRGTRKAEGKTDFFFIDFDVTSTPVTHRHAEERRNLYAEIYAGLEEVAV